MPSRWWNVTALEDVLGGRLGPEARLRPMRRDLQCKVHKAPADVMRPLLVGGGRCKAVVGPFVVMNRPLLSLFANESLLQRCRESYLRTNATASDESFVYAGAAYNNDHLISYCAFSFFPRTWSSYRPYNPLLAHNPLLARLSASPKFAYSMYMPDFHARIAQPRRPTIGKKKKHHRSS